MSSQASRPASATVVRPGNLWADVNDVVTAFAAEEEVYPAGFVTRLAAHRIDGPALIELTEEDLENTFLVASPAARQRILDRIDFFRQSALSFVRESYYTVDSSSAIDAYEQEIGEDAGAEADDDDDDVERQLAALCDQRPSKAGLPPMPRTWSTSTSAGRRTNGSACRTRSNRRNAPSTSSTPLPTHHPSKSPHSMNICSTGQDGNDDDDDALRAIVLAEEQRDAAAGRQPSDAFSFIEDSLKKHGREVESREQYSERRSRTCFGEAAAHTPREKQAHAIALMASRPNRSHGGQTILQYRRAGWKTYEPRRLTVRDELSCVVDGWL